MLGVQRKVRGKVHRISIAEYSEATKPGSIIAARDKAAQIMAELAAGTYMTASAKAAMTDQEKRLAALTVWSAPDFHAEENPHVRDSTIRSYRFAVKRMFPTDEKMSDIDADMVRDLYRAMLGKVSDASAANAIRSVRALWQSWADAHPDAHQPGSNPVRKLTRKRKAVRPVPVREGALTPAQRPVWWSVAQQNAVHAGPTGTMFRALQMLFLTGCRMDEVLHLSWADIGETEITISAERMKAGEELKRPITCGMRQIFDTQRDLSDEWVFPSRRGGGPAKDPRKAMAAINRVAETAITQHDLRRTYISVAEVAGIPTVATKMLVGHSASDITADYAKALRPQLPDFAAKIELELLS